MLEKVTAEGNLISECMAAGVLDALAPEDRARAQRLAYEQRWNAIQSAPAMQITEVQQSAAIQELQSERSRTASALADLRERYDDSFPQVAELAARLGEIENQILVTGNDIKAGLRNEYRIALRQESALERELQSPPGKQP